MISIDSERGEEREVEVASGDACDTFFFFFLFDGPGPLEEEEREVWAP